MTEPAGQARRGGHPKLTSAQGYPLRVMHASGGGIAKSNAMSRTLPIGV